MRAARQPARGRGMRMSTPQTVAAGFAPICSSLPRWCTSFWRGRWPAHGAQGWPASSGLRWWSRPCWSYCCCWATRGWDSGWTASMHPGERAGIAVPAGLAGRGRIGPGRGLGAGGGLRVAHDASRRHRHCFFTGASAWGWLLADAAFFALAALAEEVAFRGYGFQRFAHAVGPLGAALGFAAFYAIVQALVPGSNHASVAVSVALSLAAFHGLPAHAAPCG